jgi:DNA-binding NarL/FixJ family response regulator
MPTSIPLLVGYPKELIRAGLRAMLEKTGIKIVGEASDAPGTLALAKKHKPAVVILDAGIPGGDAFELVGKIQKSIPATKVIMLSAVENPTYIARAKAAGASNFLLMSVSQKELATAIENAAAGKSAMEAGPFRRVVASMTGRPTSAMSEARITPRESQVLSHVAFGLSNEEIAQSLEISVETVKEHVQNLLRKLAVNDRTQAAVWAVRSGVV